MRRRFPGERPHHGRVAAGYGRRTSPQLGRPEARLLWEHGDMHRLGHAVPVLLSVVAAGTFVVACSSSKSNQATGHADAASGGASATGGTSDGGDGTAGGAA